MDVHQKFRRSISDNTKCRETRFTSENEQSIELRMASGKNNRKFLVNKNVCGWPAMIHLVARADSPTQLQRSLRCFGRCLFSAPFFLCSFQDTEELTHLRKVQTSLCPTLWNPINQYCSIWIAFGISALYGMRRRDVMHYSRSTFD